MSTLCHVPALRGSVVLLKNRHRQRGVLRRTLGSLRGAPHGEVPRICRAANRHTLFGWRSQQMRGLSRALHLQRKLLQLKLALRKYVIPHIGQHSGSRRINLSRELCAEIDKFGARD